VATTKPAWQPFERPSLRQQLRIVRVIAAADFKLKYTGSLLGYVWSVLKPLALFTMLYFVFTHVFRVGAGSPYYPVSLLTGIVLFYFFCDATLLGMSSIVGRSDLLRKLSFPRMIIPISATMTAALTLCINMTVIAGFIAYKRIVPRLDWLLIPPLLLELYVFTLGVSLILATLFVRMRDLGQVWELVTQLLMYACPIIYAVGYLPPWSQKVAFFNPFTQVLQDIRSIVIYQDLPGNRITAADIFGTRAADLLPIGIAFAFLAVGVLMMKREEPWFAERV
jgi:ABC-2 type transport system permease protein